MRVALGRVAVLFALTLMAGCGGSSGGPPIPFDQLGSQFAAIFCQKMFMCCTASEITSIDATAVDQASCQADAMASSSANLGMIKTEIDAGLITYHGDRARRCLDWLAALSCRQWAGDDQLTRFAECQTLFEGTLATGSACATGDECQSGYCGTDTGQLLCTAPAQLGGSCEFAKCVQGLTCQTGPSAGPRTCQPALPDGASCYDSRECASGHCIADGTGLAFCGLQPLCDGI